MNRESALAWLNNRMKSNISFINGSDVIEQLGVAGPKVKEILDRAWQAQQNGIINNREEALQWLKTQQ